MPWPRVEPKAPCSVVLTLAFASCAILSSDGAPDSAEELPAWLDQARAEALDGHAEEALAKLRSAREVEGLGSELRIEIETLLEEVAAQRIRELEQSPEGASELEDMVSLGLPGPLAVSAGVSAARKYLAAGRPYRSYKLLKELEQKYPTHHERRAAGEILVTAGLRMAAEKPGFLGFFSQNDEGIEALEWLVVTYPSEPRCDEAYFRLAELYAADREFALATVRYEELVEQNYKSSLRVEAEARIPRMRLMGLESPEYDRRELLLARRELEDWLEEHAGNELEPRVRLDHTDCLRRLATSDQVIARFYQRIGQAFGTRIHAQRALETARSIGDQQLVAQSERLLLAAAELSREGETGTEAGRFLDAPEAETAPEQSLPKPIQPEGGGTTP